MDCDRFRLPIEGAPVKAEALDLFVKDRLRVRLYARCMDDFIILAQHKAMLWELLAENRHFLVCESRLLSLNPKTSFFPASHGVDFAGYRHWSSRCLPLSATSDEPPGSLQAYPAYTKGEVSLGTVRSVATTSFVGCMQPCKG